MTQASARVNPWAGTFVTKNDQSAKARRRWEGVSPLRLASALILRRRAAATTPGTRWPSKRADNPLVAPRAMARSTVSPAWACAKSRISQWCPWASRKWTWGLMRRSQKTCSSASRSSWSRLQVEGLRKSRHCRSYGRRQIYRELRRRIIRIWIGLIRIRIIWVGIIIRQQRLFGRLRCRRTSGEHPYY